MRGDAGMNNGASAGWFDTVRDGRWDRCGEIDVGAGRAGPVRG